MNGKIENIMICILALLTILIISPFGLVVLILEPFCERDKYEWREMF